MIDHKLSAPLISPADVAQQLMATKDTQALPAQAVATKRTVCTEWSFLAPHCALHTGDEKKKCLGHYSSCPAAAKVTMMLETRFKHNTAVCVHEAVVSSCHSAS